jgi:flagellin
MKITDISAAKTINTRTEPEDPAAETPLPLPRDTASGGGTQRPLPPHPTPCLDTAISNAFDGIALLETADRALEQMLQLLDEMAGLTHRAVSRPGTTPGDELDEALQLRLVQLERIAEETVFRDKPILMGGLGCAYFQVGNGSGRIICINLDTPAHLSSIGAITCASAHATTVGTARGSYSTPVISNLNFFTAPRHANLLIDGISVGLYNDWSANPEGAAAALQNLLNRKQGDDHYRVSYRKRRFHLHAKHGPAPLISAASVRGVEFLGGTVSTASGDGSNPLELSPGELVLQPGDAQAIEICGKFRSLNALASAINSAQEEVHAGIGSDGALLLQAKTPLTISGGALGFRQQTYLPCGSLADASLLKVSACNQTHLRIESARDDLRALRERYALTKRRFDAAIIQLKTAAAPGTPITRSDKASALASQLGAALPQRGAQALACKGHIGLGTARLLLQQEQRPPELAFCLLQCPMGQKGCE